MGKLSVIGKMKKKRKEQPNGGIKEKQEDHMGNYPPRVRRARPRGVMLTTCDVHGV